MTTHERNENGPEEGATEIARVLHGDQARAERYEQPDVVTLPGDTHVAAPAPADDKGRAPKR